MFTNIWRALLSLCAFGLVTLSAANAFAQRGLSDGGEFFDKQHEQQAVKLINDLHSRHGKDVRIETFAKIPDDRTDRLKQVGAETFFKDWLKARAQTERVNGVFVLICRQPPMIKVGVNESTRKSTFTEQDREALWKLIKRRFDNKQFDEGLIDGLKYIQDRFAAHATSSATAPNKTPSEPRTAPFHSRPEQRPQPEQEGVGIMGWIVFGVIVLIAFLVIRALFRAMSGGGAGGYGAGPMMGSGGGWGSSFLSGLFGAAAGSYLYDSFFRSHSSSNWDHSASAAEPHPPADSGAASNDDWSVNDGGAFENPDSGASESGGDDFGGGDFGGGGDDF